MRSDWGRWGRGWKVSLTTLMNEHLAVGEVHRPDVEDLVELSRSLLVDGAPAIRNGAVRERIAEWYARTQGLKFTRFRTMTALSRGQTPGPENSIHKLVNAGKLQDIASYGLDLMGMAGLVMDDDMAEAYAMFQQALLSSPSARTVPAGSDEISAATSLPKGCSACRQISRVDKNKLVNEVPTGGAVTGWN